MRDSKPQHKSLKVTRNATNRDKHINEASKQIFADNLLKVSCKYRQGMLSNCRFCFNVFNIRIYDELLCNLSNIIETVKGRTALTSQFNVSKLQKQLQSVKQIHLDPSANFGPLTLIVCVTLSHKVAFNSTSR